jgi:DNA invertase Pin-like site-specific DNA recombinase
MIRARLSQPPPSALIESNLEYIASQLAQRGQDPENQLRQLRAWCASAGHQVAREYVDHASGGKGAEKRPEFAAMLSEAHKRQFDLVLCWALDRLSREGMVPTVLHLQRLASYGVGFHSYTEPMLSTDNEMVRDIVLAVMASLAKIERQKISERTRAGMERVRQRVRQHGSKSGKAIGRPSISARTRTRIVEMLAAGTGLPDGNVTLEEIGHGRRGYAQRFLGHGLN